MKELEIVRQYLHQHPEVSQLETNTQNYLLGLLERLSIDSIEQVASTGLLLHYKGKNAGKNILFRGDIDALPIQETITESYKSIVKGVSHKCGHDGHTTILYGLAKYYAENRPERGDVFLLFQPAEENGWGARAVVESGLLKNKQISMVFALHNLPGYKKHLVVCREGSFTSSVVSLAVHFKGYTAHAAEPWHGRNPARAMSRYTIAALQYNMERKDVHKYVTVTPVYTMLGSKSYGISAGEGTVHLTIRADVPQRLASALEKIKSEAITIAVEEELELDFEYIEPFDANVNNAGAVEMVMNAASILNLEYEERPEPFRWGEDFGLFTGMYPGAMFGIGAGEDCMPLHHPAYNYPDEITQTGINMFLTIQKNAQDL
jgi:amidohydrolase